MNMERSVRICESGRFRKLVADLTSGFGSSTATFGILFFRFIPVSLTRSAARPVLISKHSRRGVSMNPLTIVYRFVLVPRLSGLGRLVAPTPLLAIPALTQVFPSNQFRLAPLVGNPFPGFYTTVATADFNRDGKPDLLVINPIN